MNRKIIKLFNFFYFYNYVRNKINNYFISYLLNKKKKIIHNNINLKFYIPNDLTEFRVNTFSTKEPETLEWIDSMMENKILWDVGANIGLYSIYAAKKGIRVISFEPSVFNLELLTKNINLNNLNDSITIFTLPLSEKIERNTMRMTNIDWGGALSTFGKKYGWDGKKINKIFEYSTFSISIDMIVKVFNMEIPNYLKIDVDGIEHLILNGGNLTLQHVDSILIEINDDFIEQSEKAKKLLETFGFKLYKKTHGKMIDNFKGFEKTFNQIWVKNDSK